MLRFLSPAWVDAYAEAVAAAPDLVMATDDELVIQHVVTDVPDAGEASYHLVLSAQPASAAVGRHPDPTVTFTQTYDTAAAIASGASSAQAAFMAGSLRLGGRVDVLMANQTALAGVDDAFAELRADTEY